MSKSNVDWENRIVEIAKLYYDGNSPRDIIELLHLSVTVGAVIRQLKKYGYKTRGLGISHKLAHYKHENSYIMQAAPNWKEGKKVTQAGYFMVLLHPKDPFIKMAAKSRYVMEHRLVMAKHLGRCLEKWEIVHHRDANKKNNNIENLELLPNHKEHYYYTRVECKLEERVKELEKRVTILEAENALLKAEKELTNQETGR